MVAGLGIRGLEVSTADSFEARFPGFIDANERMMRRLSTLPRTRARDQGIEAAQENLRWAEQYKRTGIDPEIFEEIRFQQELSRDSESQQRPAKGPVPH
jgi:hypothetical protein